MPTLYWAGTDMRVRTKYGEFSRNEGTVVSQEWLDMRRGAFDATHWRIEEDYPGVLFTQDDGDGIPDMNWLKADIQQWLYERGVEMSGLRATKAKMLEKVDEVLAAEVVTEEE
tara:strand:- start:4413 stop:4751 length:339 start_codon:yes stop_codon:yes gene_type:complete